MALRSARSIRPTRPGSSTRSRRVRPVVHRTRPVYIGMDDAGRMCGKLVKEALPDGGEVFIFIGRLEQDNARRRRQGDRRASRQGFRSDPLRPAGSRLEGSTLSALTDQFDLTKGKANAEDALVIPPWMLLPLISRRFEEPIAGRSW